MSSGMRAIISKKNPYYIDKDRYYELKHFCKQYKTIVNELNSISSIIVNRTDNYISKPTDPSDPTYECVLKREKLLKKINIMTDAANETDPDIGYYILWSVTDDLTYEHAKLKWHVPCCRNTWYDLYRRFFYILDKLRD